MYRLKDIQEALKNVVGWEQAYDPAKVIDKALTKTESGLYFQGAHPLLTLDNMRSIMPDDWGYQYPEWVELTMYKQGDKVRHAGAVWMAKITNGNEEPAEDSRFWVKYNVLSDFLSRLTYNGISTVIQQFTQIKQLDKETKNLLERRTFFDGAGRIRATLQNKHKLVGFEIVPVRAMGVTTKLEKIGLQMTGAT